MAISDFGNLLATVVLGGTVALLAVVLQAILRWRERLRPGALALVPVRNRRGDDGAEWPRPTRRSEL